MLNLPPTFAERVQSQLGNEYDAFIAALSEPQPISIRWNPRKVVADTEDSTERIPWCKEGRYLAERPIFTLDPLFHGGAYYVQEASSMLLQHVLEHVGREDRPLRVLDLCAAPGGKATLLASWLRDSDLLVANEAIRSRLPALRENLTRWGWPNVIVANHDPDEMARVLPGFFDVVVVDAPCSGEGLFRKDPDAVREWSVGNAALCAARQHRILEAATTLVSDGGLLVYSTCTYNPAENDENLRALAESKEWEVLPLTVPAEWGTGVTEYGLQCWPHRCKGEGFYIAVLRRAGEFREVVTSFVKLPGTSLGPLETETATTFLRETEQFHLYQDRTGGVKAVPESVSAATFQILNVLPRALALLTVGNFKGKELVPAHELALSVARNSDLPTVALSREEAIRYLRKDPFELPEGTPNGWTLATYSGLFLGWLKIMPGRFNNYLPTEARIRMLPEAPVRKSA